ncbi:hypothetical protein [Xenorhabdus budapestensis]|uniref:Uncharacterized protein n=1 Tax=Xenorhabdus budapestensis TaxID=290110 RepID=A0A2D0IW19_XENBU|nr:hypothetical protein [Xenorhabdus budapestensis]PHM26098.1 hypothetical protein Xbud_02744 [Xenorhabdus budapestensis]
MQLIFPKAPANGVHILRPALQAALDTQGFGINPQFAKADPSKISLSEPYRGYSLTLDDLAKGQGLGKAALGTWHYLIFADGVAVADARLADVGDKVEFVSLNYGKIASASVNALALAESSSQLQGKTFELRLLFVSALHFVAIWLHTADEDVLIPIEPTPKDVAVTRLFDEAGLLALLTPAALLAKKVIDADNSGRLGG